MKKLIVTILTICAMTPALAQHHGHRHKNHFHHHHQRHWHPHHGWVVPLVIGGAVTYALTRPQIIVEPAPVVIDTTPPAPAVEGTTVCTEWKEIQTSDGKIYRERSCYQR